MKLIKLTKEKYAIVDDADFELLNKFKWYAEIIRGIYYAARCEITKVEGKWQRKHILMHRVILGVTDRQSFVDHIDHNGLNNQSENLRVATISQNNANRRTIKKYLGVAREVRKNGKVCWRAACCKNGITYRVTAVSEIDAEEKYNQLALKHHGNFAKLNIIK